jgi:hypothetical protein
LKGVTVHGRLNTEWFIDVAVFDDAVATAEILHQVGCRDECE